MARIACVAVLAASIDLSSAVALRHERSVLQRVVGLNNATLLLTPAAASLLAQAPGGGACAPTCTWQCQTPTCDQVCEPKCQAPRCETRCQAASTAGCETKCDQPQCAVVCQQRQCSAKECSKCKAACSEPMCIMSCPRPQPCRNVCEEPVCDWECNKPTECPKPVCQMMCENPKSCPQETTIHAEMPPLKAGEITMQAFKAPVASVATPLPSQVVASTRAAISPKPPAIAR
eukprot:TRINITY_DN1538_c0_g1_i1.p1 TRINITY_DN1538_c0_g1~~TRINITY_DN1538_c0_g1_i1.p1  ORF type:complete len:232 (-),score=33.51 TRINITY_DN1538_c0_g1_i1:241-936(-)